MSGWNKVIIRNKTKQTVIRLKKEKGCTEDELVEYALLKTFGGKQ